VLTQQPSCKHTAETYAHLLRAQHAGVPLEQIPAKKLCLDGIVCQSPQEFVHGRKVIRMARFGWQGNSQQLDDCDGKTTVPPLCRAEGFKFVLMSIKLTGCDSNLSYPVGLYIDGVSTNNNVVHSYGGGGEGPWPVEILAPKSHRDGLCKMLYDRGNEAKLNTRTYVGWDSITEEKLMEDVEVDERNGFWIAKGNSLLIRVVESTEFHRTSFVQTAYQKKQIVKTNLPGQAGTYYILQVALCKEIVEECKRIVKSYFQGDNEITACIRPTHGTSFSELSKVHRKEDKYHHIAALLEFTFAVWKIGTTV